MSVRTDTPTNKHTLHQKGKSKYNGTLFFKAHYIKPKEEDNNHFRVSWQKMSIHSHTQTGFYFPEQLCHQHYHQMATPLIFSRFSTWCDVGTLCRLKGIVPTKIKIHMQILRNINDKMIKNKKAEIMRNKKPNIWSW